METVVGMAKRRRGLEIERRSTPPSYDDGVSEEEFEQIIVKAKKSIPRIKSFTITGLVVDIEVKSQSGISIWKATIDFNDFGHLTGWYRVWSENDDSNIPKALAREAAEGIHLCKEANGYFPAADDSWAVAKLRFSFAFSGATSCASLRI